MHVGRCKGGPCMHFAAALEGLQWLKRACFRNTSYRHDDCSVFPALAWLFLRHVGCVCLRQEERQREHMASTHLGQAGHLQQVAAHPGQLQIQLTPAGWCILSADCAASCPMPIDHTAARSNQSQCRDVGGRCLLQEAHQALPGQWPIEGRRPKLQSPQRWERPRW